MHEGPQDEAEAHAANLHGAFDRHELEETRMLEASMLGIPYEPRLPTRCDSQVLMARILSPWRACWKPAVEHRLWLRLPTRYDSQNLGRACWLHGAFAR
eukprot:1011532-Pelagomonas_calceolata.AAC.4